MKKSGSGFINSAATTVLAVLSALVLTFLCAGAVKTEKNAAVLTEAVLTAQSASESFYSASGGAELAELLSGKLENGRITAERKNGTVLIVSLSAENETELAEISVSLGGETVYSLNCRKAALSEGEK